MSTVDAKVRDILTAERYEVGLQTGLVAALHKHLMDTIKVTDVSMDMPTTVDEWSTTAKEAFEADGKEIPSLFLARLKRWLAGDANVAAGKASPLKPTTPGVTAGGGGMPGPVAIVAAEIGVSPSEIQDDFDALSITSHTKDKAFADMRSQGMLPSRISGLAMALETGKVHPPSELVGMVYAGDVRATTLVKDARKAKMPLFSKALEDKDLRAVVSHLNALMRDLADHGKMHEAALLSGWFQEWQQMFQGDDKLAIAYLVEYMRVYAGRGLPTPFDYGIMFRVQKSMGGGSNGELEELRKELKSLKGTVNNLTEQCASLKKKAEAASKEIEKLKQSGGNRFKPVANANTVCNKCGKKGHFAADCTAADDDE